MIIDCHTHCFPTALGVDPRAWAAERDEPHWADLVAPADRKSIQDWTTPRRMLEAMEAASVDRAILLGWYWQNEATCRWHNEQIAAWCATDPDRFIGYAAILPNENTVAQLDYAHSLGLRGVGELHPGVQQFRSDDSNWQTLADWCTAHRWPVSFHCTRPSGDHPQAVATPLDDYVRMVRNHPELIFIFAHWGGGLAEYFKEGPPPNAYYDCSASPLLYDWDIFARVIASAGPDKVLFGSDYPLRLYPKRARHAEMRGFVQDIQRFSGLSQVELNGLMGENLIQAGLWQK